MRKENRKVKPAAKEEESTSISRRDFIKLGVGAAAVTASAAAFMGKLPLSMDQPESPPRAPATRNSSEPIVATVKGDQVTVMNGQDSVKVNDPVLAALIAARLGSGN